MLIEYHDEPHGVFATQTHALACDLITFMGGGLEGVNAALRQADSDAANAAATNYIDDA